MNPSDQSQLPQEFERTGESDRASTPVFEPVQKPTPEEKPKKGKAPLVLGILLVLASCAVLGWMSYGLANQNASLQDKVEDKDKQIKKLTSQLSEVSKPVEGSDDVSSSSSSSDSEVVAAALAAAKADVTYTGKTLEAAITKEEGDFAAVNVVVQPDGPNFRQILKKSDSVWISVFLGSNAPSQDVINRYAIPASISQP